MQVVIWLLTCSVFVHVYAFRFFLFFHCVSVFVCVCVCPFYSMDLCGLIQIKKEKKERKTTEYSTAVLLLDFCTCGMDQIRLRPGLTGEAHNALPYSLIGSDRIHYAQPMPSLSNGWGRRRQWIPTQNTPSNGNDKTAVLKEQFREQHKILNTIPYRL